MQCHTNDHHNAKSYCRRALLCGKLAVVRGVAVSERFSMNDIPHDAEFPLPSDSITSAPHTPPLELDIIRSGTAEIVQTEDTYHHPLIIASEGRGAAGSGDAGIEPQAPADNDQEQPIEEPAVVPPEAGRDDGPVDPPEDPPSAGAAESPDDPAARVRALLVKRIATVHESEALLGPPESPYYVVSSDGVARPKDPSTGEVIGPGEIPPSLLTDENLRRGIEFLQEHGEELSLRILLVGSGERDALPASGVQLHAEAQAVQAQGGSLYIEGLPQGKWNNCCAASMSGLLRQRGVKQWRSSGSCGLRCLITPTLHTIYWLPNSLSVRGSESGRLILLPTAQVPTVFWQINTVSSAAWKPAGKMYRRSYDINAFRQASCIIATLIL